MPAVAFVTLGCKVNRAESETLSTGLAARGIPTTAEENADLVVLNTCTVSAEADAKVRKALRRLLSLPRHPIVAVTGCLAALGPEALSELGERVVVLSDRDHALAGIVGLLGDPPADHRDVESPHLNMIRTRALVKVQDGCDARCSYCIVPDARGGPRSIAREDVLSAVNEAVAVGAREVVLTGVNLGEYSHAGMRLPELTLAVLDSGVQRVRISSIEPTSIDSAMLDLLAMEPRLCGHLHIPLQSGSNRILEAMRRRYSAEDFARLLADVRAARPTVAITTDVIAGFPGESEADAEATELFCESSGFTRLHVFRYSERPGTPAARMSGRVDPRVRSERAARLRTLDSRLRSSHAEAAVGTVARVLVESCSEGRGVGVSEDYLRVGFPCEEDLTGRLVDVRVTSSVGDEVRGSVSPEC